MPLARYRRHHALQTIFWFLGGTIGAHDIIERFEDRLDKKRESC